VAGAEELGAEVEELPLFLPTPSFMVSAGKREDWRRSSNDFFCLSFAISLVFHTYLLGKGLGGGQRGACNVPPLRGQRTGTV